MQIHELKISGFKSFSGTIHLTNLSSFTSITGLNGLGKSNILDAIIFCLHLDTPKQLRIKKLQDVINQSCDEAKVTVTFCKVSNYKSKSYISADLIVIERSINKYGKQKTSINNQTCTTQTLKKLLSEHNIRKSTQNMILQGNITKLLSVVNFETFIEETAGIKGFEEEKRKALEVLKMKESKLQDSKESLARRIEPFIVRMREERYNYIEQSRREENKEKNLARVLELENSLRSIDDFRMKSEIKKEVSEYLKLQKELESYSKVIEEEIEDEEIYSIKERIDEKEKEIEIMKNEIKMMNEEVLIVKEEECKKVKLNERIDDKDIEDIEGLNKKLLMLKEKENFIVENIKREEKTLIGLTNSNDLVKRIEEINDLKMRRIQNEEKIKAYTKSIDDLKHYITSNSSSSLINISKNNKLSGKGENMIPRSANHPFSQGDSHHSTSQGDSLPRSAQAGSNNAPNCIVNLNKTEDITKMIEEHQRLFVDDYEINNLNNLIENKKAKLNYPILEGVYGTLIENIEVKDARFKEAIDIILGGRRNYVIVENENVGEEVIKMNGNKKINVIPLNKIKSNYIKETDRKIQDHRASKGSNDTPDTSSTKSLQYFSPCCAINYIKYAPFLQPAIEYIFGSFYICFNANDAKFYCFNFSITCITINGNVYDPRGIITGGNKSKEKCDEKNNKNEIIELENKLKEMKNKRNNFFDNLKFVNALKEYLKINKNLGEIKNENLQLKNKIEIIKNCKTFNAEICASLKNEILCIENILKGYKKMKEKNEKIKEKNEKIIEEIKNLNCKILNENLELKNLKNKNKEFQIKLHKKELKMNEKNIIEEKIKYCKINTAKIKNRIQKIIQSLKINKVHKEGVCKNTERVNALNNKSQESSEQTKLIDDQDCRDHEHALNKSQESSEQTKLVDNQHCRDQYINEKENGTRMDFDLGESALMIYKEDLSCDEIENEESYKIELLTLKNEIEKLNKNVKIKMNPKNFELLEKNEESLKILEERIQKLENDKLKIEKSLCELNKESENEMKKALDHINNETGLFLKTFIKDSDLKINNNYEIQVKIGTWKNSLSELSGGQRSIVALCLIFAMLSYKPAPFYLFDEIDSALDLSFTQSVGKNIQKRFGEAQFIVVSLKEGLFENAGCIWQVYAKDGKSDIRRIK